MPRRPSKSTQQRASDDSPAPIPEPEEVTVHAAAGAPAFLFPQPNRDPQSNWEVDLAKNLEEYLLKICSGEVSPDDYQAVNFAEAALVLQGSVQVYSRKVEYLYTLVLHALEFIAQKQSGTDNGKEIEEGSSSQPDRNEQRSRVDEDETFLGLDDVPEDPKNSLDDSSNGLDAFNNYVKPPANLVVLEGDCLDTTGDAGELETYLLSTCNFFGDFLLLDPCDAEAVEDFMRIREEDGQEQNASHRGGSQRSKTRNIFVSPAGRSVTARQRSSIAKKQKNCTNDIPAVNLDFNSGYEDDMGQADVGPFSPAKEVGDDQNAECFDDVDCSDEDEDPWKPLNPHEPGCLKVKPYKRVTSFGTKLLPHIKQATIASEFPLARLDGIVSPEFAAALELSQQARGSSTSQPPTFFEKLRQSLYNAERENFELNMNTDVYKDDGSGDNIPEFSSEEFDTYGGTLNMDEEIPLDHEKQGQAVSPIAAPGPSDGDALDVDASLEDLCRVHLDSLLASIAESEKQTELATRVSTWKQRIEHSLEEEDHYPPFDIHLYGEKVLAKLSSSGDGRDCMCFRDVVRGLEKREIARTFSAMLQLVNNGDIELNRKMLKHESLCYTSSNSFSIRLLNEGRRKGEIGNFSLKKRLRSPLGRVCSLGKSTESPILSPLCNGKLSFISSKESKSISPEQKRQRRRHQMAKPS